MECISIQEISYYALFDLKSIFYAKNISFRMGQKQVLWLFLFQPWHKGRRRDGRPAGDGFHGLQSGIAIDLYKIVQRTVTADPTGKPAPFAVGNPQSVMGFGAVDIAGHMGQLLGFAGLQVGEQVHLPCPFDGF